MNEDRLDTNKKAAKKKKNKGKKKIERIACDISVQ